MLGTTQHVPGTARAIASGHAGHGTALASSGGHVPGTYRALGILGLFATPIGVPIQF